MENYNNYVKNSQKSKGIKSLVAGILAIAAGIVLLFSNLNMIDPSWSKILFSWQTLVAAIGFIFLFDKDYPFGIILLAFGILLIFTHHLNIEINIEPYLWPSVIVLIGLLLIIGSKFFRKGKTKHSIIDDSHIEETNIFSDSEHVISSKTFKKGKFVCIFGASKLNLLQSDLVPENAQIEIVAIFGGIQLYIPQDWIVKTEVFSLFGGFSDKRSTSTHSTNKTIVIKGVTIFGGGEIKSIPD